MAKFVSWFKEYYNYGMTSPCPRRSAPRSWPRPAIRPPSWRALPPEPTPSIWAQAFFRPYAGGDFSLTELSRLTDLAHSEQARVYVAMNTLVKPGEPAAAYRLIHRLARQVKPDGLIVQDLAFVDIARQAGFEGGLFLSTLANLTSPQSLLTAKALGASRVILPRELSIDEIRLMGEACPDGLDLECFIHGALCYCVSGRCYWSSYMGGKSGLRGRCVQPCRRVYRQGGSAAAALLRQAEQQNALEEARRKGRPLRELQPQGRERDQRRSPGKGREGRFFSCLDLSLDVLAKTLLHIPHLVSWKIEGRKKGPHYVYHVVTAYRMLRDNPGDAQARKDAEEILQMALGRPGTRARFLPQKDNTIPTSPSGMTSSGLLAGKIRIEQDGRVTLKPHFELLPQDYLRVGVEDERWHATLPVTRRIPKAGTLLLRLPRHKTPKAGTPVFLIDRREPELMALLREWQDRLAALPARESRAVEKAPVFPPAVKPSPRPDTVVRPSLPQGRETRGQQAADHRSLAFAAHGGHFADRGPTHQLVAAARHLARRRGGRAAAHRTALPGRRAALRLQCSLAEGSLPDRPQGRGARPRGRALLQCRQRGGACGLAGHGLCRRLRQPGTLAGGLPRSAEAEPAAAGHGAFRLLARGDQPLRPAGHQAQRAVHEPQGRGLLGPQLRRQYLDISRLAAGSQRTAAGTASRGYSFFARLDEHVPQGLPEARRPGLFNWEGALL